MNDFQRVVQEAFLEELALIKSAGLGDVLRNPNLTHPIEAAGLGVLALPGLDTLQSRARARMAGDKSEHGAEKRRLIGETGHAALDVGGLAALAGPSLAHMVHK